jgi:hypothetical protein
MAQAARQGNDVYFRSKSLSVTRRTLANLVGLAALYAFAPLPLIGEAMALRAITQEIGRARWLRGFFERVGLGDLVATMPGHSEVEVRGKSRQHGLVVG